MQGQSTVTQLFDSLSRYTGSLSKWSGSGGVIHLDFSKAFDKVSHNLLMKKLAGYGISGSILQWFNSYLSERYHRVVLAGEFSDSLPVTSGVPQGSILGPLLFIIYANDIPDCLNESKLPLFADDSKRFRTMLSGNSPAALRQNDFQHSKMPGATYVQETNTKSYQHRILSWQAMFTSSNNY